MITAESNQASLTGQSRPTLAALLNARPALPIGLIVFLAALITAAFWHSFVDVYGGSVAKESLYSHALFIPFISLFFVWRQRAKLLNTPLVSAPLLGFLMLGTGCFMLLLGDFLGFMTFVHYGLIPVLAGLCLIFLGLIVTRALWFPIVFLSFMLPLPYSLISVISFKCKMFATESAVKLGQLLTLSLVQDGSYVYLGSSDRLLVGDVCGGMRSLIALLAFGALMAYISKTRGWARILILLVSPIVAIVANIVRIFFLCVIGYIWGSEAVTTLVHDISGIGIFALAFVMLFSIESLLRWLAPASEKEAETT